MSGDKPIQAMSTHKKTGVVISKCYNMLCGQCGKRFSSKKLYLLKFRNYACRDE